MVSFSAELLSLVDFSGRIMQFYVMEIDERLTNAVKIMFFWQLISILRRREPVFCNSKHLIWNIIYYNTDVVFVPKPKPFRN